MTVIDTAFEAEKAPCGKVVNGIRHEDRDDIWVLTDIVYYACGCRRIHHEYHDGCVSNRVIHHKGTVLLDELLGAE